MASLRAALSLVESAVKTHKVVVFSKTTCPFSILAKKILTEAGVKDMKVFEIERREDAPEIQVRRKHLTVSKREVWSQDLSGGRGNTPVEITVRWNGAAFVVSHTNV